MAAWGEFWSIFFKVCDFISVDQCLRDMFRQHDKDMSGFIGKEDILVMLLNADKVKENDPIFKTNLRFLINIIKEADKDGDQKISFEEFKDYINKANEQST
uniref:EF-hand domain-containing protein n=1 Tax=Strongyloides papillosus TaxID=174720 RepID=A0A0N5BRA1_STREA